MKKTCDILIAGVGGQGNLLCGRVLGEAGFSAGYRPVIGETFGASRRGGTVFTHVRIGVEDVGPLIPEGAAGLLVGLEPMESLRAAVTYGGKNTVAVLSVIPVQTVESISGKSEYPPIAEILAVLSSLCLRVYAVNPTSLLLGPSNSRALNSFMLGATAGVEKMPMDSGKVRDCVARLMQPRDTNLAAFDAGMKAIGQQNPSS